MFSLNWILQQAQQFKIIGLLKDFPNNKHMLVSKVYLFSSRTDAEDLRFMYKGMK